MRVLAFVIAIALLPLRLYAGSPDSKCFDGNADRVFSNTEAIAFGTDLESKMPEIKYNPDGTPAGLNWVPLPPQTSEVVLQIGRYMNRGIYRVTYRTQIDYPNGTKSETLTVMFGLDESARGGPGIRPFFIDEEDVATVSDVDSIIVSTEEQPFALEIETTQKGTGVFTTTYTFVFSASGARILERSESGRRMDAKTYHYDKSGKVVKAETSKDN